MSDWAHPICERCWIRKHSVTTEDGDLLVTAPGELVIRSDNWVEQCCFCQRPTIIGAFWHGDPDTIPDHVPHT